MRYLLAIILPPVAVLLCGKPIQFVLNILLTLCLWIPGMIHALMVVSSHKADQRTDKVVQAMQKQGQGHVRWDPQEAMTAPKKNGVAGLGIGLILVFAIVGVVSAVLLTGGKPTSRAESTAEQEPVKATSINEVEAPEAETTPKEDSVSPLAAAAVVTGLSAVDISAAKGFLEELGLRPPAWQKLYGDTYGCSSPYKELGEGFPLPNNIAYYLTGNREQISELKIVLNVNAAAKRDAAHVEFAKAAALLYESAVGTKPNENFSKTMTAGNNVSGTAAGYGFELNRIVWPTGKGYELQFIIRDAPKK